MMVRKVFDRLQEEKNSCICPFHSLIKPWSSGGRAEDCFMIVELNGGGL